jgi:thiamine biosynthesis lipoprotein
MRTRLALLLAACCCVLGACGGGGGSATPAVQHVLEGSAFGTYYRIKWWGGPGPDQIEPVLAQEIARGNELFNTWSPDSVVSRFNAHGSTEPFAVPSEFARVLDLALTIGRQCGGAYDPTIAPLLAVRGFGPMKSDDEAPSEEVLDSARRLVGLDRVEIVRTDDGRDLVVKAEPGVALELSSIAKGTIVDWISRALVREGARDHLVDIGGELYASGTKADGSSWTIGVERPVASGSAAPTPEERTAVSVLPLRDGAIATSGSYRNFVAAGQRHHILDPRTGENATHPYASVSVLAATCELADALATALMVTGFEDGLRLLEHHQGASALFLEVLSDGSVRERAVGWPD